MDSTLKVGINGLGRIGRAAFKVLLDTPQLEVGGINDLIDNENLAYLLKYDTVYGRYPRTVDYNEDALIVDGKEYPVTHIKDPASLSWQEWGVDLVFECTGVFTRRADLEKHIEAAGERYAGVLGVTDAPLVSADIVQDPRASIIDLEMTQVVDGDLVKVMSWYDNEWGYANQMVRQAMAWANLIQGKGK